MKNKFSYAAHTILIWFIYILVFYIMKFSLNGTELLDFKTLLVNKKGVAQCKICKCSLSDKTLWSGEKCPKNKWT